MPLPAVSNGRVPRASGPGVLEATRQAVADPLEPLEELFRDLRASVNGLSARQAARRLEVSGPNEPVRRGGRRWPGELARQFTHPLALLLVAATDLVFSGSQCTGGEAQAVVTATGIGTELGRIAALSQRVGREESPLEHRVKRVARLIAFVAQAMDDYAGQGLRVLAIARRELPPDASAPGHRAPFPFIVWGADESRRALVRRRSRRTQAQRRPTWP
jgi:magnesium-transporting ATPase (P-type)